jgi:glutathione synthase/RimK-type ligase-like ATP-grasp enzyme
MEELDSSSPWYTQEFVEAEKDITVAFVRDQFFAFELPREGFVQRTIDWREVSLETATSDWPTHQLPDKLKAGIFSFMRDMGLHYGRLDFLYTQGKYVFLEVNSNGEWGWLDVEGKYGLRDKIAKEVSPLTPVHSVPTTRDIRLI